MEIAEHASLYPVATPDEARLEWIGAVVSTDREKIASVGAIFAADRGDCPVHNENVS